MGLIEDVITVARGEVGVTESPLGSNWGTTVTAPHQGCVADYIRAGGYDEPVFWCLCFQYWVVQRACAAAGLKNPLPRTGSCDLLLDWARRNEVLHAAPAPGDLFLYMKSASDATHTGLVSAVRADGALNTIEGNSNDNGSSNGIEVVERRREIKSLKFVRWADTVVGVEETYTLFLGGNTTPTATMPVVQGASYAPLRAVTRGLGFADDRVTWDDDAQAPRFDKDLIPGQVLVRNGASYVPVRGLAAFFGLHLEVDVAAHTVRMKR